MPGFLQLRLYCNVLVPACLSLTLPVDRMIPPWSLTVRCLYGHNGFRFVMTRLRQVDRLIAPLQPCPRHNIQFMQPGQDLVSSINDDFRLGMFQFTGNLL